jgi:uncharacterized protein involved in outer membrane biogenesis
MKTPARIHPRRGGIVKKLLFTVVFLAAAAVLAWILFLPALVTSQITRASGFPTEAGAIRANPFGATVHIEDLRISNPEPFAEKDFVHLALFDLEVEPLSLMGERIEIPRLQLDLRKIVLVTNKDGTVNAKLFGDRLQQALGPGSDEPTPPFRIGELVLRLGIIEIIDHSRGSTPTTKTIQLGVDRRFTGVTDIKAVLLPLSADLAMANADALSDLLPPEYRDKARGGAKTLESLKKLFDSLRGNGKP